MSFEGITDTVGMFTGTASTEGHIRNCLVGLSVVTIYVAVYLVVLLLQCR